MNTDLDTIAATNYRYAQECLETALEIRDFEEKTAETLMEQGDQIRRIGGHVETVHKTLDKSEKKLSVISSIFGTVQNLFNKKEKGASLDKAIVREATPGQGLFITRTHREQQSQEKGLDYRELDRKTDEVVDQISLALVEMREIATAMGKELDRHNQDLTVIESNVDQAIPRIQRATRLAEKAAE